MNDWLSVFWVIRQKCSIEISIQLEIDNLIAERIYSKALAIS